MTAPAGNHRLRAVVGADRIEDVVATGFNFLEGPAWHPHEHHLVFSDIPGDAMYRWSDAGGVEIFRSPSNMANGNAYDQTMRLVTCEHATSRVTRTELDGRVVSLADSFDGRALNSPNDIVVKSDGAIYFTDPTYGRQAPYGKPREPELAFRGVYRITRDGQLELLVDDFAQPNGLCFSPDEKWLYVNDTEYGHIRAFPVSVDGRLGAGTIWAVTLGGEPGAPDGMKVDAEGNVYCCGPGGLHVFNPAGELLGVMTAPEVAVNFVWGGADLTTMFICASTSLYCVRTKIPGPAPA